MPKKTKKEKILAHYHRKIRLLENRQVITPPVQIKTPVVISESSVIKETKIKITEPFTEEIKQSNQYFFSDLKKSLLLIVLIIGVEVGLYFVKFIK